MWNYRNNINSSCTCEHVVIIEYPMYIYRKGVTYFFTTIIQVQISGIGIEGLPNTNKFLLPQFTEMR